MARKRRIDYTETDKCTTTTTISKPNRSACAIDLVTIRCCIPLTPIPQLPFPKKPVVIRFRHIASISKCRFSKVRAFFRCLRILKVFSAVGYPTLVENRAIAKCYVILGIAHHCLKFACEIRIIGMNRVHFFVRAQDAIRDEVSVYIIA